MSRLLILRERERKQHIEWRREFQLIGDYEGNGYSFPCNSAGKLDESDENYECWIKRYNHCIEHPEEYEDRGVVKESWWYTEPAYARCSCGNTFYLNGDTQCECCNQWYNGFGQTLLSPEYWEEEY